MRRSVVAGLFYPSDSESLKAQIAEYTSKNPDDSVIACVSPHAGYMYSGRVAGRVHSLLPDVETYVIIGPNHTGYGSPIAVSVDEWETPLGVVEVDVEFVKAMPHRIIDIDEIAHREEHSIEVQVPFLQYLHKDFKIVPICVGMQDDETAYEIAQEIIAAKEKLGREVVVIASSDMHHYLPDERCRRLDEEVIKAIEEMDVRKYFSTICRLQASVCGYGVIAVAMNFARHYNAKANLVAYATSGEVANRSNVVGYAGIVFNV
ncbi:putative dioxygenase [Archaeoglobus sulfaticallidus PM70-1]|uniref:MEMO1 family protein Asulf_00361 n=1 Tax=Archaeoglobus sulfaticallidus PM70-1 TaxID=387631 RepID=N0BJS2_9EURY|nr:MEMO1 family protein [Archaeoglobus sulfaticallidus]AGK60390.1 putative dioxygenase [Archaeoglobus sulfaticallidus PM70-1]